jgi:hypothetical protein
MQTLSYVVLSLASLFAAILLYRQPYKLTQQSKINASLIGLSCMFICSSAVLPLFINPEGEQSSTLLLMLENLHQFLALPLLCSVLLSIKLDRAFTKGTWGRWCLALIASFELCRRAEIGDYYSHGTAIICLAIVAFGLLYKPVDTTAKTYLIRILALICFGSANLMFNNNALIDLYSNTVGYNLSLSIALILICLVVNRWLETEPRTS